MDEEARFARVKAEAMSGTPDFASVVAALRDLPQVVLYELHCHPRASLWLRMTASEAEQEPWLGYGGIGSLTGVPVIEHDDMQPGEWELRANGEVVKSGRLS